KLRRRLADELAGLEEERRSVGRRLRGELDAFRRETNERLRTEVDKLRERFAEGRRRGLEAEAVETLFAAAPVFVETEPEAPGPVAVGETVRHIGLGWQGVLDKLEPGRAEVLVKGKRLRCRPEELAPVGPARSDRTDRSNRSERSDFRAGRRDLDESVEIPPEINLIGQRVEPALEELDSYIDQALLSHRREVRVVHGHGTGRLRQ